MGVRNSSLTRVKPLFDFIDSDVDKLNQFFGYFKNNTLKIEKNSIIEIRYGDNEKKISPSRSLLIWMLQNLKELNEVKNFGVDDIDSATYKKRKALFSGDKKIAEEAIRTIQIKSKLPDRDWYIFEGKTHPDIFIETIDSIFIGEAKRTEKDITTKTKWLSKRDQLIRHIDSVLDQSKQIYSFYILDKGEYLKGSYREKMKLYSDKEYYNENLRHREDFAIEKAMNSFIGFVFWEDIAENFKIKFPDKL
jgi:hypothetical protein